MSAGHDIVEGMIDRGLFAVLHPASPDSTHVFVWGQTALATLESLLLDGIEPNEGTQKIRNELSGAVENLRREFGTGYWCLPHEKPNCYVCKQA